MTTLRDDFDELDAFLGAPPPAMQDPLGVVVAGSLSRGLDLKLKASRSLEELAVGRYVVINGEHHRFFAMVTDVALDNTNPQIEKYPPDGDRGEFLHQVYGGATVYGRVHVVPLLVLEKDDSEPKPVKTIPPHFSRVFSATEEDVNLVFGHEDERHFHVGEPLDMADVKVHLDLQRLVERSAGVFGKSGTGKSFLTRVLLAGIIERSRALGAVGLVFDMHNDYGWELKDERGTVVKGLKQLFGQQVAIFTLDEESSRRRNAKYDAVVTIGWEDIDADDLAMSRLMLDLSEPMIGTAYALQRLWGRGWLNRFLEGDALEAGEDGGQGQGVDSSLSRSSLEALYRRLKRLTRFDFLLPQSRDDTITKILEYLSRGITVVLEFGRYGNALEAYIFVANFLTRRIHEAYVRRMEKAMGDKGQEPLHLVIVVEEAHKFLEPQIARQTIFGTIARELRKYNVTLLIVDQRPSGIDEEVMSQIGTRVTALLDNEKDISAVLTGISGAAHLREVLARLDTRQQALIMGHAVPMPVVVQTRTYDADFYASVGYGRGAAERRSLDENVQMLRGPREEGID